MIVPLPFAGIDFMGVNARITATCEAAPLALIAIDATTMGGAMVSTT